jgi:hypothetical protein
VTVKRYAAKAKKNRPPHVPVYAWRFFTSRLSKAAGTHNKPPGRGVGSRTGRKAKRGIVAPPDTEKKATAEIRGMLENSGVPEHDWPTFEREYVSLAKSQAKLQALAGEEVASNEDLRELRRCVDRPSRIRKDIAGTIPEPTREPLDATDRRRFCELHLTTPKGTPYSLEGREWQETELWNVLDGYKAWPVDTCCPTCRARAGEIVSSVYDLDETRTAEHAVQNDGCRGLHAHMVWLVCLHLKRQQGKTTAFAGYAISSMFRTERQSFSYFSGSEDQSERLVKDNFTSAMDPEITDRLRIRRTGFSNVEIASDFALYPCSLAGTTGGTRTIVGVDEARDVPGKIFTASLPQIYARNGWRCPSGKPHHAKVTGLSTLDNVPGAAVDPSQKAYGQKCDVCGERLEPWCGRAVVMSSAQELDGSDADWFHNLCDTLQASPQPDAHCFRTVANLNPDVSQKIVSRTEQLLGLVDGLSDSINIEAGGVSRRKGEPFLSGLQVMACEDDSLSSRDSGTRPAVAFLDTSETTELTSLVIFEDDAREGERAWHRIVEAHIKVFDPKRTGGVIDENEIEAHLYDVIPRFGCIAFRIDDRLRPWARAMRARLKREAPFKNIVKGCLVKGERWHKAERKLAWEKTDERFVGRTIRLIPHKGQRDELKGARRLDDPDGGFEVREKNRRVRHLDIAEGVASCCLMVHEIANKPRRTGLSEVEKQNLGAHTAQAMMRRMRSSRLSPRRSEEWY